jgi:hypothetical protein
MVHELGTYKMDSVSDLSSSTRPQSTLSTDSSTVAPRERTDVCRQRIWGGTAVVFTWSSFPLVFWIYMTFKPDLNHGDIPILSLLGCLAMLVGWYGCAVGFRCVRRKYLDQPIDLVCYKV